MYLKICIFPKHLFCTFTAGPPHHLTTPHPRCHRTCHLTCTITQHMSRAVNNRCISSPYSSGVTPYTSHVTTPNLHVTPSKNPNDDKSTRSEDYRYRQLSPGGVSHTVTQDDKGYSIVKQLTFGDACSDVVTTSDVTSTSDLSRDSSYHELDSLSSSFTSSSSCENSAIHLLTFVCLW